MDTLDGLLAWLPNAVNLPLEMKEVALSQSVVPDVDGNLPGSDDYVTTYDPYYAAFILTSLLEAQPQVTNASSEGTSVAATLPNWDSIRSYYRSLSPILSSQSDVITLIPIPDQPHVRRTNMREAGGYFDDLNTDFN